MENEIDFPKRVPPAVVDKARNLLPRYHDKELVRRLATDKRMKSVWRALQQAKLAPSVELARWWGLDGEEILDGDSAAALFFTYAFDYVGFAVSSSSDLDVTRKDFERKAAN